MSTALRSLLAMLVAAVLLAVAPATSFALVETIPQNADGIEAWVRQAGSQGPPSCGTACTTLTTAEDALGDSGSARRVWEQAKVLRTRVGVLPALRGLGVVGMGITSFQVGWQIGTGIRSLWTTQEIPPAPAVEPRNQPRYAAAGDVLESGTKLLAGQPSVRYALAPVTDVLVNYAEDTWVAKRVELSPACGDEAWAPSGPGAYRRLDFPVFQGRELAEDELVPRSVTQWQTFDCVAALWEIAETPVFLGYEVVPDGVRVGMVVRPVKWSKPVMGPTAPDPWPDERFGLSALSPAGSLAPAIVGELDEHPELYGDLLDWLDAHLGGDSPDPTMRRLSSATCAGLGARACTAALRDAGVLGDIDVVTLDFDHAATGLAGDVVTVVYVPEVLPLAVPQWAPSALPDVGDWPVLPWAPSVPVELPEVVPEPARWQLVPEDARVVIVRNPAVEDMPVRVPAPLPQETQAAYVGRLQRLGLVGRVEVLPDADVDLDVGPDGISRTQPRPGSRVRQGSEVDVAVNPPTAPAPGPGPSQGCGLVAPTTAIDWTPVTGVRLGDRIPFSLLPFVGAAVDGVAGQGQRPNVTFHVFGVDQDLGFLVNFETPIGYFRLVLTFLLWVGVAWFLYGCTIGRGG